MRRQLAFAFLVSAWLVAPALAQPAQVILIRHAEKPPEGSELSARGLERAAALAPFFQTRPEVLEHQTPVAIYAQKSTDKRPSIRAVETVKPLAQALKLDVTQFSHSNFEKMVVEIKTKPDYKGRMVLICWEHNAIPDIAHAFGVEGKLKWKGSAFDRLWIVTFAKGKEPTLRDLPQKLLFGDSPN